jgi:hypothetical protein
LGESLCNKPCTMLDDISSFISFVAKDPFTANNIYIPRCDSAMQILHFNGFVAIGVIDNCPCVATFESIYLVIHCFFPLKPVWSSFSFRNCAWLRSDNGCHCFFKLGFFEIKMCDPLIIETRSSFSPLRWLTLAFAFDNIGILRLKFLVNSSSPQQRRRPGPRRRGRRCPHPRPLPRRR